MNQSAIPTGISASISPSITTFMARLILLPPSARCEPQNGSRAAESSMNPVDAYFCKEGVAEV
jgi:hypothetical protein